MAPEGYFSTNPITTSLESKRMQAMYNSSQLIRGINETVEDYQKRMAQWREEFLAKQKVANTYLLQNKLNGIDTKISTNLTVLQNTDKSIASLLFWQNSLDIYDSSLEEQIDVVKAKRSLIQQQIAEIKKNGEKKEKLDIKDGLGLRSASEEESFLTSLVSGNNGMYDNDVLKTGSRNILS